MPRAHQLSIVRLASTERSANSLIADNIQALEQGIELIERLDDRLYTQVNHHLSINGVGSHFRHCIDFYHNFLAGLELRRINYDCRMRDERIEQDRPTASARLKSIVDRLDNLPSLDDRIAIEVLLESSVDHLREVPDSEWSRSSIKRELQFLLSHTIHHYSLIALALRLQDFDPGAEFGVAPSTLRYWRKAI